MKITFILYTLLVFAFTIKAQAPYTGGLGSGYISNNSPATICPLYFGGNADGTAHNVSVISFSLNGPVTACGIAGTTTTATYSTENIPGATYAWSVSTANILIQDAQNTNSLIVLFKSTFTSGTITVTVTTSCSSSSKSILIRKVKPSTPGIITGPANACEFINDPSSPIVRYAINKVAGATSYTWTLPDGINIVGGVSPFTTADTFVNVTYASTFIMDTIKVQAVNACGISNFRNLIVNTNLPGTPGAITGPTNACPYTLPNGVIAVYKIKKVVNASSYIWNVPSGCTISHPVPNGPNDTLILVQYPDTFVNGSIAVQSVNACGINQTSRTMAISRLKASVPGSIFTTPISSCPIRVYSYSLASMPANATSINWTVPQGGTITSGEGSTSIIVSYEPTAITGFVTATSINNCSTSSTRSITINLTPCQLNLLYTKLLLHHNSHL